jgi:hypothetical protein
MDIEGAEFRALQGAGALVRFEPKPVWLVEITFLENRSEQNPHFLDTFDIFFDAGYAAVTADAEERRVTRDEVRSWAEHGRPSTATHNWLFLER